MRLGKWRRNRIPKIIRQRAKWMRRGKQTVHEGITKFILNDLCKEFGFTLKVQKPFHDKDKWYIADFFIPELGLVIEVDGPSHEKTKEYDNRRSDFLNSLGYLIERVKNEDSETKTYRSKLLEIIDKGIERAKIDNRYLAEPQTMLGIQHMR